MRKFYINVSCFCLLLCSLAACSNNDDLASDHRQFSLQSSIGAVPALNVSSLSRTPQLDASGKGTFTDGDMNSVFFLDTDNCFIKSFSYTYGNMYYWDDFQLAAFGENLKVSACYPVVKADNPTDFLWDVTSKDNVTADFMAASPVKVKQGVDRQIPLHFSHLMHKLVIMLEADGTTITESDLSEAKIVVSNFYPQALINLLSASVKGTSGQVAQMQGKGTHVNFILPPQSVGLMEVKIDLASRSQVYKLADLEVGDSPLTMLESGKAFILKVKVSKSSFTVTGQGIGPWGSQGEANGEIIL